MSEYAHARAYLDPLGIVCLGDGRYRQGIELVLSDDPDRDPPGLADPVCQLDSTSARQLGRLLLSLAEQAEHPRRGQGARR